MRKFIMAVLVSLVMAAAASSAYAVQVNVKSPANLKCHANEMKNALIHMNQGQNFKIDLEVFCQYGAVKYISLGPNGSTAQFVPPGHVIYKICGNPCKK